MRSPALALFLSLLASCTTPSLELAPRYGLLAVEGEAGIASGGVGGAVDLEQAGLEEEEGTIQGRIDLDFGSPQLVFLGQAPRFEGSGTLGTDVSDGTNTITANTAVDTELDLGTYDALLLFDLVPGDMIELGLGFGAAYVDLSLAFEESGGTRVESAVDFPMPLVAAMASLSLGPLELGALACGMEYTYEDDAATYIEGDAFLRCKLFGGSRRVRASLVVGYRLSDFEVEYDDDSSDVEVDVRLKGPYAGLEITL